MSWEAVIGVETHVELSTESKMFCGCAVEFGAPPNTNICPVCLGLPGALPVINRKAIEDIVSIGLALDCEIADQSVFHRKNYFYADLPKNYQISQYDVPVCRNGHLDITVGGDTRRIGIERAHMEEDTGKSTHLGDTGRIHAAESTLLDFNRSGVPLVEIVSQPDIRSAAQARVYAQELRELVSELGVSDARMEEGSIRFDANVSIREGGSARLGTKVEIKNMNSFRSLERAIAHEIERQIEVADRGDRVVQETRHWDEEAGVTYSMRTKEESSDYRYFVEPDLVPMAPDTGWVEEIAAGLPELPSIRRDRYRSQGLDDGLAGVLSAAPARLRQIYEEAIEADADPRPVANWLVGEVTAWARRTDTEPDDIPLEGRQLAELIGIIDEGIVSASAAKEVLDGMLAGEGSPRQVAEQRELVQISDTGELTSVVERVLAENPDAVESYRSGEDKVIGFLVGQVMRETGGRADPRAVNEMLRSAMSG